MNGQQARDFAIAGKWIELFDELDSWRADGRRATFWWRDDDAQEPSRPLSRLLELSALYGTPLLLAVIPEGMKPELAGAIAASGALAAIAQHGIGHHNNAPEGEKNTELHDRMLEDESFCKALVAHRCEMERLFGPAFLPVMVPPWNRIGPGITARLPKIGYRGLSADGRTGLPPREPFRQVNVHVDLIDWHDGRRFIGTDRALSIIIAGLRARREARDDEPLGIMTHHLVHDRPLWAFLAQFLALITGHPATRWPRPAEIFSP